jgi:hypothetical protein
VILRAIRRTVPASEAAVSRSSADYRRSQALQCEPIKGRPFDRFERLLPSHPSPSTDREILKKPKPTAQKFFGKKI